MGKLRKMIVSSIELRNQKSESKSRIKESILRHIWEINKIDSVL